MTQCDTCYRYVTFTHNGTCLECMDSWMSQLEEEEESYYHRPEEEPPYSIWDLLDGQDGQDEQYWGA